MRNTYKFRNLSCLLALAVLCSCSSTAPKKTGRAVPKAVMKSPALANLAEPLVPVGQIYNNQGAPILRQIIPGSPAARSGFRVGDLILQINGEPIRSIADFDKAVKHAPPTASVLFARGDERRNSTVQFVSGKMRFGGICEPAGRQLYKPTSPLLAYMKNGDMTVHAQASFDEKRKQLRFNFVIESLKSLKKPKVQTTVAEKENNSILASVTDTLDAVGSSPVMFSKSVSQNERPTGPLKVGLTVNQRRFLFEFQ